MQKKGSAIKINETPPCFYPDHENAWIGCEISLAPEDALKSCPPEQDGIINYNGGKIFKELDDYHLVLVTDAIESLKNNNEPETADLFRRLIPSGMYLAFHKKVCSLL